MCNNVFSTIHTQFILFYGIVKNSSNFDDVFDKNFNRIGSILRVSFHNLWFDLCILRLKPYVALFLLLQCNGAPAEPKQLVNGDQVHFYNWVDSLFVNISIESEPLVFPSRWILAVRSVYLFCSLKPRRGKNLSRCPLRFRNSLRSEPLSVLFGSFCSSSVGVIVTKPLNSPIYPQNLKGQLSNSRRINIKTEKVTQVT